MSALWVFRVQAQAVRPEWMRRERTAHLIGKGNFYTHWGLPQPLLCSHSPKRTFLQSRVSSLPGQEILWGELSPACREGRRGGEAQCRQVRPESPWLQPPLLHARPSPGGWPWLFLAQRLPRQVAMHEQKEPVPAARRGLGNVTEAPGPCKWKGEEGR